MKKIILLAIVTVTLIPLLARGWTALRAQGRVYRDVASVPSHKVAIVFGAGVRNDRPSEMLYDRVVSAVALYKAGRVNKLLMSGDNRSANYNEPAVMRRTAQQLGVPDQDIVLDDAGRSTYDTCYRARDIYGLKEAVLVTQDFHLDRALMLCDAFGMKVVGYAADRREYRSIWSNELREIPATMYVLAQLFIMKLELASGERAVIERHFAE